METEELLKECTDIVEKVCEKFAYDGIDKEGNDSLKTVLLKVIPAMLKDAKKEARDLFYQMLIHTPIVITENLTQESYNELLEQYIGKDLNQHITEEETDLDEYGKDLGAGAYVSRPILDENLNLQGKKSFVYIQKVVGKAKDFFGTEINVAHLIHELGHAWHSEKEQFIIEEDGTLKERVGTAEFIYLFSKTIDNKFIKRCTKTTGLMLEESMNTIAEEKAMANYMGISIEEMRNVYNNTLIPSNYQGFMSSFVEYMLEILSSEDFERYRLYGETESKNKINELMEKTSYWINRQTDILPSSVDSPRSYGKKKAVIDKMTSIKVQEFFEKYKSIYFPDISEMTPLDKIDNVLAQNFNMKMIRYSIEIDIYKEFLEILGYEGYSLINQASDLKKKQELLDIVSDVRSSELSDIIEETRGILETKDKEVNIEKE